MTDKLSTEDAAPPIEARDATFSATPVQTLSASEEQARRDVHPSSFEFFEAAPWVRSIPVLGHAVEAFGPKMIFALGYSYFFSKGAAGTIMYCSMQPMYMRRFGTTATRYQRLASLSVMGWATKAFVAAITDAFALFGYTKRWYMFGCCIVGAAVTLGYGLLPAKESSANGAAAFVFLACLCKASIDVLSEGHYSRQMRKNPRAGPYVISWVWWMINAGNAVGYVIAGPMSDAGLAYASLFISSAMQLSVAVFYVLNWYGELPNREERLEDALLEHAHLLEENAAGASGDACADNGDPATFTAKQEKAGLNVVSATAEQTFADLTADEMVPYAGDATRQHSTVGDGCTSPEFIAPEIHSCLCEAIEFNKEGVIRNWKIVAYSALMTAAVLTLAIVTILGSKWELLYACIAVAVVCCGTAFFALPLVIAKATVFLYFNSVLYLSLPGALNNFYLADEECVPGGPHFSYTFFYTVASVIASAAGVAGAILFSYFFSKHSFQLTFIVTTVLEITASLFDLIIVKRWNIAIGIPDHAMYICGDTIIFKAVSTMSSMPVQVLMSRLCPRGSESMVFAIMAGFANTGNAMSNAIGSLLMELVWPVDTRSTPCDFSNVPYLIITGHLCLPLIVVPLAFILLPKANICDELDKHGRPVCPTAAKPSHDKYGAGVEEEGNIVRGSRRGTASMSSCHEVRHTGVGDANVEGVYSASDEGELRDDNITCNVSR